MISYDFICDNQKCTTDFFEVEKSILDDSPVRCPCCKTVTTHQVFNVPQFLIYQEPTTLGHQAARNTSKLGHYEYEAKSEDRTKRIRQASKKMLEATGGKNIQHDGTLPFYRSGEIPGLPKMERPLKNEDQIQKVINEMQKLGEGVPE